MCSQVSHCISHLQFCCFEGQAETNSLRWGQENLCCLAGCCAQGAHCLQLCRASTACSMWPPFKTPSSGSHPSPTQPCQIAGHTSLRTYLHPVWSLSFSKVPTLHPAGLALMRR